MCIAALFGYKMCHQCYSLKFDGHCFWSQKKKKKRDHKASFVYLKDSILLCRLTTRGMSE